MARGRVKKRAKLPLEDDLKLKDPEIENQEDQFADQDVEQQSAAIRAIRDVEIGRLLMELRLLRSSFNQEQLQTPVLQFFAENFPNLSMERDGENGQLEVKWKTERKAPLDNREDVRASLLHRLSIAYSGCSAPISFGGGFELSTKTVKTRRLAPNDLQIGDFVLEEPSETQMLEMQEAFQTPGISSHRLSVGMTPKTLRLPKPGEMLLSVRGSPLGVYKEDNMEAIRESEEG